MASLSIQTTIQCTIGGETLRFSDKRTLTVGEQKHDAKVTVADNDGTAVLWGASSSPIDDFTALVIIVDPDDVYADNAAAAQLTIELAGSSDKSTFRVRREAPLILAADDIGSDIDNLDQTIETITAKNENADGVGDVGVRILIF